MVMIDYFDSIADETVLQQAVKHVRRRGVTLPTFKHLANPSLIPRSISDTLTPVDPDSAHPLNLWRIHWYNDDSRRERSETPIYLELPSAITGVQSRIILLLGDRFPLIETHKVLAAYSCFVPRLVTGRFDPTQHKAIWPSTGNYARGGMAISRLLGCRGVAVMPEDMSAERFKWLNQWIQDPDADLIRTIGGESNVKEIYDACKVLDSELDSVVINQFSEVANHLAHYQISGPAFDRVFETVSNVAAGDRLAAFVAASGSAGTLGVGDYLKERHAAKIVAVEALECPTMLYNGFGSHNIQGIGDKHIPLIHNVMNTDVVIGVSDRLTDSLLLLFNTDIGRRYLLDSGIDASTVEGLRHLGLSAICNLAASIKLAKHFDYGPNDIVLTVATDNATMYESEMARIITRDFANRFTNRAAMAIRSEFLDAISTDHILELGHEQRQRMFNLGYFTWVEQQEIPLEAFEARRKQSWWKSLRSLPPIWDSLISEFNDRTGVSGAP